MPSNKKIPVKKPATTITPQPSSTPPAAKHNQPMMIGLMVGLIIIGLGGGYYAYQLWQQNSTANTIVEENEAVINTNEESDINVSTNLNTNIATTTTPKPSGGETVKWSTAKKVSGLSLLGKTSSDVFALSLDIAPVYENVGTFTSGKYKDQQLVRVQFYYEGPQQYPTVEYYAVAGKTGNLLFKPSNPNVPNEYTTVDQTMSGYTTRGLTVDTSTVVEGLFAPDTIIGPKPRQVLLRDPYPVGQFDATGMVVAFTDPVYGPVYMNPTPVAADDSQEMMSQVTINQRYGFYLKLSDGMVAVYQLKFDFITYDSQVGHAPNGGGVLQATWTDGTANKKQYDTTLRTGCGSINYTDVVQPSEVNQATDLTPVGTTSTGDVIYGYQDVNAPALKKWYDNSYQVYDGSTKKSYATFTADHPIVFVVDSFDRLARLTSADYQLMAECGKPVIYLYPPETTNVDVTLQPQGGFTYTEPTYNTGWHVIAHPDGQLTELSSGKTYPYLFWEGRGGIYTEPTRGFVVAQADVHAFLVSTLAKLGLNEKETSDFIEFWEPKMQGSPYYQVAFMGNRTMDEIAPLTVTPPPDSVIRILMDFKPLQKPVTIQPQIIHTPKRIGFTVVEWGGVLR